MMSSRAFRWGCRTKIKIHPGMYRVLANETRYAKASLESGWQPEKEFFAHLLIIRYQFVITLVHELAHALNIAVASRGYHEAFYKGSIVSEGGYTLEKQLFGGQIQSECNFHFQTPRHSANDRVDMGTDSPPTESARRWLGLLELPSHKMCAGYKQIGGRVDMLAEPSPFDVVWRVPVGFVEALFTKEFWGRVSSLHDKAEALRPSKKNGWIFASSVDRPGELIPLVGGDATLSRGERRRAKKNHLLDVGPKLRRPSIVYDDWSDVLVEMENVWQQTFGESCATT